VPVSRYQKGKKTSLDFTEARDSEWQWHQLGHMQVCTSIQTDNHASTQPLKFFYRPDALPAAQPKASKHLKSNTIYTEYAESSEKILCLLAVCMVNNDYKKIFFSATFHFGDQSRGINGQTDRANKQKEGVQCETRSSSIKHCTKITEGLHNNTRQS